jgi:membrane-associated phospholipid phosphatase
VSLRRAVPAGAAVAFAALAVLVAHGSLTRIDQWAIDHAMANVHRAGTAPTLGDGLVPLLGAHWDSWLDVVANIVTAPASLLLSFLIVGAGLLELRRRGRPRAAAAWAAAWVAGNLVELLCKATLERPALYRHGLHLAGFDSSYPSGHTIRSLLIVAVVATVWPARRLWAAVWAAATIVLLEVDALHTVSDLAGGMLLTVLLVSAARAAAD